MNRRSFIKKTLLTTAGTELLGGYYSWQIEPEWLEFVKLKMPIENLPKNLAGKIIMQISDLHIGSSVYEDYLLDSFQKSKKYDPDYVVYTGDFVHAYQSGKSRNDLNRILKQCVHGKSGTIGILGNHDYGRNWSQVDVADEISEVIQECGISLLRNQQQSFEDLNFIGFDDYWSPNFNPKFVMNNLDHSLANIVLCHNPDVCDQDVWNNYPGWILSGHTHGGQVKPPFLNPPMLPVKNKKYSSGKINLEDGRTLYVNRALGYLKKVRFNVRPEITLFELA